LLQQGDIDIPFPGNHVLNLSQRVFMVLHQGKIEFEITL